ncbi:hypothetical protein [Candidatus Enterovibrio escicola]|uniref:hypothetical protein n=1 Tax=Candidatus Enterovibrio escicola TaxID=1927127 RepID=UPI001238322E
MTIVIPFHQSRYRDFKTYYIHFICRYLTNEFSELTSDLHKHLLMQSIVFFKRSDRDFDI